MKFFRDYFIYIVVFVYFVAFFSFIYIRWRAHVPSLDYHAYIQMYWNTANGDIMTYNRSSETQYSLFSAHFSPFLLMIFPFYLIFKHPLTLYFIFGLVISLSFIPLYFFALDKLKNRLSAALVVLSFFFYFPFLWTHHHGFAEESFATPFLFFAFYCAYKKKPWLLLFFSFLTLSLRINMVIPVFLLGVYAVFKKETRIHGVFVCLLSIFWLYYTLSFIYPKYTAIGERFYVYGFFGQYGNNLTEIAGNIISHPTDVIKTLLSQPKLLYILHLFGPVLFLAFLAPEILFIGMPMLLIEMLANYPRLSHSWTYYHSSSLPFIWLGLVAALERIGKGSIIVNLLLLTILGLNLYIDYTTPNGQHMPFSKAFDLRLYELNKRDALADLILKSIPETNSIATQHSHLEHTAQRRWQFPATNFNGYAPGIVLLDMWASSGGFQDVPKEDPYTKIAEDSFFFVYARNDLVKKYSIKDFVKSTYKNYDPNTQYLATSKPDESFTFYSSLEQGIPIEISEAYHLVQKLAIQSDNAYILEIPIERANLTGPNSLLDFTKNTVGNLKLEILEGTDFTKQPKTIYTNILKSNIINHKTTLIYVDLEKLKIQKTGTYWLKLSLDQTRKDAKQIFNKYKVYLGALSNEALAKNDSSSLFYSLNAGKTWSSETYSGRNLTYSITYVRAFYAYSKNSLENGSFITKGTPESLRKQFKRLATYSPDYQSVVVVGSITEKL